MGGTVGVPFPNTLSHVQGWKWERRISTMTITFSKYDQMVWSTRKGHDDLLPLLETGFEASINGGPVAKFIPVDTKSESKDGGKVFAVKSDKKSKEHKDGHKAWVGVQYGEQVTLEVVGG
jgi:hypothetical protein